MVRFEPNSGRPVQSFARYQDLQSPCPAFLATVAVQVVLEGRNESRLRNSTYLPRYRTHDRQVLKEGRWHEVGKEPRGVTASNGVACCILPKTWYGAVGASGIGDGQSRPFLLFLHTYACIHPV